MATTQQQLDEESEITVTELEARIGRQAITIETLREQLVQAHADYCKLIANVAHLLTGELPLERFKILPDGLSWQVLADPQPDPPADDDTTTLDTAPEHAPATA